MNFKLAKLKEKLQEKLNETLKAVLPILAIVLVLCFTIAPLEPGILLAFLLGAVLLIVGMMFFTLGVDMSMTPIGENVGTCMTQTKKLWVMILLSFILGFIVTISEPDLQVLAEQVPSVPNMVLVLSVAFGVGIFLVAALLRMLFNITLAHMLLVLYVFVFALAFFVPGDFIAVAFDAGGVTTGPMTVPFIMALGIGISAIRSDERAEDDSFGLVALSSIGPILSVLVLSLIYHPESAEYVPDSIPEIENSVELWEIFYQGDGGLAPADHCILCDLPDHFPEDAEEDADQGRGRNGLYLCGACPLPHRRQCRFYAGGKLPGAGACGQSL